MKSLNDVLGLVPEEPIRFGANVYTARRDAGLVDGMPRWQVYVNNEPTSVGFVQGHWCPLNDGAAGLLVFGPGNQPSWVVKPGRDDGCLSSYANCLLAFEVPANLDGHASYRRLPDGSYELLPRRAR